MGGQNDDLTNIYIVAIIKNEGPYLREWIEYHLLIGVEKFIIYDNGSSDDTYDILSEYIRNKIVEYHWVPIPNARLHHPQKEMYTDAVLRHRLDCGWMAFIDVDEYIVPEEDFLLIDAIKRIDSSTLNVAGIAVNWLNFGSSFHEKRPKGLVVDNYVYRSKDEYEANELVKTIANPRLIVEGGIHQPHYYDGFCNINEQGLRVAATNRIRNSHEIIRINHYASKSKEEAIERSKRRFGGSNLIRNNHDVNDIKDTIMCRYSKYLNDKL